LQPPPASTLFPYTTLFRSRIQQKRRRLVARSVELARVRRRDRLRIGDPFCRVRKRFGHGLILHAGRQFADLREGGARLRRLAFEDRKSTRLNSSHRTISYA